MKNEKVKTTDLNFYVIIFLHFYVDKLKYKYLNDVFIFVE